jgi:hypothetical protein
MVSRKACRFRGAFTVILAFGTGFFIGLADGQ